MSGGPETDACQQFRDGAPDDPAFAAHTFGGSFVSTIRNRTTLLAATGTALLALALTACGSGGSGTKSSGPQSGGTQQAASATASARNAAAAKGTGSTGGSAGSKNSAGSGTKSGSGSGTTAGSGGGGNANSDSYAYKHPCSGSQVSVNVTTGAGAAGRRVIAVRNNGANSCGLSHLPQVYLDGAKTSGKIVKPLVPSGLGGAPAVPVYAGRTAYAVIDLDPSGATTGTVAGVDELNVLADGDHMPDAETHNFPLGPGALVLKPKLGLYRSTIADAVASMRTADTRS